MSAEATVGPAVVPGALAGATTVSAGALLKSQAVGTPAAATFSDGAAPAGFAAGIQLPAVEVAAEASAMDVLESVASQARMSYRVHDGQLVVQPIGVVTYAASAGANGPVIAKATAPAKSSVTVNGKMEPQTFVSEYVVCDGTTDVIPTGPVVEVHEERRLFFDSFAQGKTALAVAAPANGVSVAVGAMAVNAAGAACDVAVGAPVELGGRVLFEVGSVAVANCGAAAFVGLVDRALRSGQNAAPQSASQVFLGFQLSPAQGGGAQWQAVVDGALSGSPVAVNAGSTYTLRMRLFAPVHVRRTQVYHSRKYPASNGLGGRDIASWVSVHCEIEERWASGTKLWALAAQRVEASPSFGDAVVFRGTQATITLSSVKVAKGPDVEASYVSSAGERLLRFGAKRDGAEAWLHKNQVQLSWRPVAGDVLKLRYRTKGMSSATAVPSNAIASVGEQRKIVSVDAPVARCSEDCENAATALVGDASDPGALLQADVLDATASMGTNIWPGDAVTFGMESGTVREVTITPFSMRGEVFQMKLKLANDGAIPVAVKASSVSPSIEAARSVAGTTYPPDLTDVQVTGVSATAVEIDCGALASGGSVEVRSTTDGFGNSTGLLLRGSSAQLSLPRSGRTEEFYLRQLDANGNYSREMTMVRTCL